MIHTTGGIDFESFKSTARWVKDAHTMGEETDDIVQLVVGVGPFPMLTVKGSFFKILHYWRNILILEEG